MKEEGGRKNLVATLDSPLTMQVRMRLQGVIESNISRLRSRLGVLVCQPTPSLVEPRTFILLAFGRSLITRNKQRKKARHPPDPIHTAGSIRVWRHQPLNSPLHDYQPHQAPNEPKSPSLHPSSPILQEPSPMRPWAPPPGPSCPPTGTSSSPAAPAHWGFLAGPQPTSRQVDAEADQTHPWFRRRHHLPVAHSSEAAVLLLPPDKQKTRSGASPLRTQVPSKQSGKSLVGDEPHSS